MSEQLTPEQVYTVDVSEREHEKDVQLITPVSRDGATLDVSSTGAEFGAYLRSKYAFKVYRIRGLGAAEVRVRVVENATSDTPQLTREQVEAWDREDLGGWDDEQRGHAVRQDWLRLHDENAKMRKTIISEFETSEHTVDPVTLEQVPR